MVEPRRSVLMALVSVLDGESSSRDRSTAEAPMNDDVRTYTPRDTSDGAELSVESG